MRLCLCGCNRPVKHARNLWATPQCVPTWKRAENCRKGRQTYAYRRRARLYRDLVLQHVDEPAARSGGRITREMLLALCQAVARRIWGQARTVRYRAKKREAAA